MLYFLEKVRESPAFYKQLSVDDELITEYNCPIDTKMLSMWASQGYFVYVLEGKKVWHIPGHSFELNQGECLFVKKGAHIVEQFFDVRFCVVVFFLSDKFIADTIRDHKLMVNEKEIGEPSLPIMPVDADDSLHAFFNSVVPYFLSQKETNKALLQLKFKELILNVIHNPRNHEIRNYFYSLVTDSFTESLRKILEDNFHYNLGLNEYAKMCGRSLSAFKRDFEEHFKTTPGRWLLERKLQQAQLLLDTSSKSVSEIAFESGFENASHFSRSFRQRYGKSPANYRQK